MDENIKCVKEKDHRFKFVNISRYIKSKFTFAYYKSRLSRKKKNKK